MKKRLVLGTTIFLIVLLAIVVLMQTKTPSAQEIDYSQYVPYPSPDGSVTLLQNTQSGAVLLYSLKEQSLLKQFDKRILVPFVGGAMWDRQSKRFLLASENPPEYIVMEVQSGKSWRLNLSPFQNDETVNLKAVLSPDGREVIAETDRGILLWEVETGAVHEFSLEPEALADLYSLTWMRPKQFIARFGARSPRLVLYNPEKHQVIFIIPRLPLKETKTLPWPTSDGKVILLTKHAEQQWAGLLDPDTGEVELLIALGDLDKQEMKRRVWDFWLWNPNPERPMLYGYPVDGEGIYQLVRLNLSDRSQDDMENVEPPFGLDAQGRVWCSRAEGIVLCGTLSRP